MALSSRRVANPLAHPDFNPEDAESAKKLKNKKSQILAFPPSVSSVPPWLSLRQITKPGVAGVMVTTVMTTSAKPPPDPYQSDYR